MSGFNDIERELARFEAEIQSLPADSGPRAAPQQQQRTTAFVPPQLRRGMGQQTPAFQPRQVYQAAPVMNVPKSAPVRPNVTIQARPIRYGETNEQDVAESPPISVQSAALARAKAVLESVKYTKNEASVSAEPIVLSKAPAPAAIATSSAASVSTVPMPANMPTSSNNGQASSSASKKTSKQNQSAASVDEFTGVRKAGGQTWMDPTLFEWDPNDHRLFCGDLGNETTDESLGKVFSIYPSFQKAKVIRDKRTNKSKGFGFVSFKTGMIFFGIFALIIQAI